MSAHHGPAALAKNAHLRRRGHSSQSGRRGRQTSAPQSRMAQLTDRLISPRTACRASACREGSRPSSGRHSRSEKASQDPGRVSIDERLGTAVHDGQYCAGRILADAPEPLQLLTRCGNPSSSLFDRACQRPERERLLPPEPERSQVFLQACRRSAGQGLPGGVALDERGERTCDAGRRCALEQDLRDDDLVGRP